ncbi:MAG: PAS domain S-box protein [Spirochaetes bacterium]|nr:PAS domain S-box protein [Spirochaetota bacterium]
MKLNDAFLQQITDNVQDAIRVIDLKTFTYIYANAYARDLFSVPGEEYIGSPVGPSISGDDTARLKEIMMDEIAHDAERDPSRSMTIELKETLRGHGTTIWTENKATFIRDEKGRAVGILSITRDITKRKLAEEQIQKSLEEKEVLLKEIHHRVKNNLQIIMSLINLQKSRIANEDIRNLFSQCTTRIRAMALIHEMLYHSKDLSSVNMKDYASTLAKELKSLYDAMSGAIKLELSMSPVLLAIDQAIPCGLIINELVSNAFKYAFLDRKGRQGTISVTLAEKDDTVEIVVKDDGIGMPAQMDIESCGTLGLSLVTMLTKQLKGTLNMTSDGGTRFTITFRRQ